MPGDKEIDPKEWENIIQILNQGPDFFKKLGQGVDNIKQTLASLSGVSAEGLDLKEVSTQFKSLQARGGHGGAKAGSLDLGAAIANIKKAVKKSFDKRKEEQRDYFELSKALTHGLEASADKSVGLLSQSFNSMADSLIKGNLNLGASMDRLGKAFGNMVLNTMGESLVQQGTAKMAEGAAAVTEGTDGGPEIIAAGTALAAAGTGMKALAATYLASGGLVTRPTLAMVGEGGQSEAVIPLDRMGMKEGTMGRTKVPSMVMDFPGVESAADITSGRFRQQAIAHFRSQLKGAKA